MKEKQAANWEKTRSKGIKRYYILHSIFGAILGVILSIILGLSNHERLFERYPFIFLYAFLGYLFARKQWIKNEKEYSLRKLMDANVQPDTIND